MYRQNKAEKVAQFISSAGLGLFALAGALLVLVCTSIFGGFTLSILWGWFVVSTFGVVQIGIVQAIGLMLVLQFMTPNYNSNGGSSLVVCVARIFHCLLALGVGYVVHCFM